MRERLGLSAERVHVVYTGISLDGYEQAESAPEVPTIGFLSRMGSNKGLDTLVEAFIILKENDKLKNVRLRIAGGRTADDKAFLAQIRELLKANDLTDDVEFLLDFDLETRLGFLQTLSVLSVPEKQPVAFALYALEALAAGVPVVEPASGVFPEVLEMTGGGVQYEPGGADVLAAALEPLLLDADYARRLGKQGREAVSKRFDISQTAGEIVRICEQVSSGFGRG
jgi:glycosyltransferase involved in cell wall biosynthesis